MGITGGAIGVTDGRKVGAVGVCVVRIVGRLVGAVGAVEGLKVGFEDGLKLGLLDGQLLGLLKGFALFTTEGIIVGSENATVDDVLGFDDIVD